MTRVPLCRICGDEIDPPERAAIKPICLWCGDDQAKEERRHWCVAPLNKSNYMLFTDTALLSQLNPKRTI
jgi:RNA polymerase-binding transcription factor DksA